MINTAGDVVWAKRNAVRGQTPRRVVRLRGGNKHGIYVKTVRGVQSKLHSSVTAKQNLRNLHSREKVGASLAKIQNNQTNVRQKMGSPKGALPTMSIKVIRRCRHNGGSLPQKRKIQGNSLQGLQHGCV